MLWCLLLQVAQTIPFDGKLESSVLYLYPLRLERWQKLYLKKRTVPL